MWGRTEVSWEAVRRIVIKYIKNYAPALWSSDSVQGFLQLGHCDHPDGCLEEMYDLLRSDDFRRALGSRRVRDGSAVCLFTGMLLGLFSGVLLFRFAPNTNRGGQIDWVDQQFDFGVVLRSFRATVMEKRLRSLTNACVATVALVTLVWFMFHMFPFVVAYVRTRNQASAASGIMWRFLKNAPVVNESLVVAQLFLVTVVLTVFTAMLHFTGMLKWMRTLVAKLWFDFFFALHGDPIDNNTERHLMVDMDILRRDTKASLGGARNLDEATTHRDWARVEETTRRRRDEIQRSALGESRRIAMSMKHVVGYSAVRRVRDAIEDESAFVAGVKNRVSRMLRGPVV